MVATAHYPAIVHPDQTEGNSCRHSLSHLLSGEADRERARAA